MNDRTLKDAVSHEGRHDERLGPECLCNNDGDTGRAIDTFILSFSEEKDGRSSEFLLPRQNRQKHPIQYNVAMMIQTELAQQS